MEAFFKLQRNIYNKRMDAAKELETCRLLSTQESSFVGRSASQRDSNVDAVMNGKQTPMVESNDLSIADTGDNHADIQTLQPIDAFSSGLLLVWGCGEFGQHGHGHKGDVHRADALGSPLWFGQDRMVLKVACGSSHTLVLTDDNMIYSWGNSNSGQLGMGNTETNPHPRALHLAVSSGTKMKGIACGTRHSFVWTQQGDCFSFGNNYSAQLGYDFRKPDYKENQLCPLFVDTLLHRQVSQVACGARHSLFLFTNGQVAAVGVNSKGQIGCGNTADVVCPKTIVDLSSISHIACGNCHSLAADVDGSIYAWGYGKAFGSKTDGLSPSHVYKTNEGDTVSDIAGGDSHSLILLSCGAVYSWGNNFEGQLGQGKIVKFLSKPKELCYSLLPGKVVSISVGETTCAAVTEDGKLYMWGKNSSQMIRDDKNSRHFQFEPQLVSLGIWKALKVSVGSWHVACVVSASPLNNASNDRELYSKTSDTVSLTSSSEACVVSPLSSNPIQDCLNSVHDTLPTDNEMNLSQREERQSYDQGTSHSGSKMSCDLAVNNIFPVKLKDSGKELKSGRFAECPSDLKQLNDFDLNKTKDDRDTVNRLTTAYLLKDCDFEEKPSISNSFELEPINHLNMDITCEEAKPSEFLTGGEIRGAEVSKTHRTVTRAISKASKGDKISQRYFDSFENETFTPARGCSAEDVEPSTNTATSYGQLSSKESKHLNFSTVACLERQQDLNCEDKKEVIEEHRATDHLTAEIACNSSLKTDLSLTLHNPSLDDVTSCHQGLENGLKQSRPCAVHTADRGHLNRERRSARLLRRRTSLETEYHLPHQPVHRVDINLRSQVLRTRPRPPMDRTQSSPSLFSSNSTTSPTNLRHNSALSVKAPRPPLVKTVSDHSLSPSPPTRSTRRFLPLKPVFSSGTSWRKRK